MVKINFDSESFHQCSYSTLWQGTDNLDLAAFANEFVSKRNATLPCYADKTSQNLQKELFLGLINKINLGSIKKYMRIMIIAMYKSLKKIIKY